MKPPFPVRFLVNMPGEPLELTSERAKAPLPQDPDCHEVRLTYGPYFDALWCFLSKDDFHHLRTVTALDLDQEVVLESIQRLDIYSEKHGAFYNVARAVIDLSERRCSLAINVAVEAPQKAFLEVEWDLLKQLHTRFSLPFLPRPYVEGGTMYVDDNGLELPLKLFVAEWFEGYHEFHLSSQPHQETPVIRVWDQEAGGSLLDAKRTESLYRRAAAILTAYLDENTFQQIYPWHHGAGDFVVRMEKDQVDVKLITARDYQCLLTLGSNPEERWFALLHFFFNLTLRMRLDRFDGTGDYAWATPDCLKGVVMGFLDSWDIKARENPFLPPSVEVIELLRNVPPEQWGLMAELVLESHLVEKAEFSFIQPRLNEHITSLTLVLQQLNIEQIVS